MRREVPILLLCTVCIVGWVVNTIAIARDSNETKKPTIEERLKSLEAEVKRINRRLEDGDLRFVQTGGDIRETKARVEEVNDRLTEFMKLFTVPRPGTKPYEEDR